MPIRRVGIMRRQDAWINRAAESSRMLRRRGPLARLAVLQHYGGQTSFLDVSRDYRVALFFALNRMESDGMHASPRIAPAEDPHLMVVATPRVTGALSDFPELGVSVVDLLAEMPSYCLRPHMQQAAFIGVRAAIQNDLDAGAANGVHSHLDDLCIARIKIEFSKTMEAGVGELFPPASVYCAHCRSKSNLRQHDFSHDTVLHVLRCLQDKDPADFSRMPDGFPTFYWQSS